MVWSTLEDTSKHVPLDDDRMPTLMGKYKVPHFDVKGKADQLFKDSGVRARSNYLRVYAMYSQVSVECATKRDERARHHQA